MYKVMANGQFKGQFDVKSEADSLADEFRAGGMATQVLESHGRATPAKKAAPAAKKEAPAAAAPAKKAYNKITAAELKEILGPDAAGNKQALYARYKAM